MERRLSKSDTRTVRRELRSERCPACSGDGVARFAAREVEALLLRQQGHLPPAVRAELELLRDALAELLPERGAITHIRWDAARKAA